MSEKIYGFDGLRALSVTLVILSHIGIIQMATSPFWVEFFSIFNADFGVKIFFVLSGFLITTLLIDEHRTFGGVNIAHFMMRRALRILPLYYLVIVFAVTLRYFYITYVNVESVVYGSLLIYNYMPRDKMVHFFAHLWSLAVEEQFYVLWPLVFASLARSKRALPVAAFATIGLCWLRMRTGYGEEELTRFPNQWTIPAIYPIMIGCVVAIVVNGGATWLATVPSIALSSVLIFSPLFIAMTPEMEIAHTFGIAGLIAWVYLNQQSRVPRLMDWGPIGYAGKISYGLYMWQGMLTGNGTYRATPGWPPDVYTGALLTIPVAIISFHFFERPISRLRKRFPPNGGRHPSSMPAL